ncbi:Penicillin-binding protein, transpeptidase [Nostoc sp. NIES-3756]|uniref:serine hydrolase n=1 Tax=Nostoc sp. NIES-3756 TaxID=1751286 RepID=UPI00071FF19E|nr:serine hydrolase [Nostoc sp. NIES-3756]BAT51212.1 Penicillin-binding protein, transpeptidase [Nostoc sp. NIES-3756]
MAESGDKLRDFSRRQPANRRQRSRKVQKVEPKKAKIPNQPRAATGAAMVARSPNVVPAPVGAGGRRPKQELVMPSAVKPMPTAKGQIPPFNPNNVKVRTVRVTKQPMSSQPGRRVSRKTRLKPMARAILYGIRLLIIGVGIGAIVGTALSVLDPANRIAPTATTPNANNTASTQAQPTPNNQAAGLFLTQEITSLKNTVQELAAANPNLTPGVFLVDLETGGYVDVNGSSSSPAASTIKIPILVAFFQDVDAGKIRLDEMLTMQQEMVAGGSGNFQYKPVGTKFAALEVATKMITISDNTATNMLIARLGGMEALNERFRSWGLTTTAIRNPLPDLQGTNTTSPKELGNIMTLVSQGNLVSMRSRDQILDIMRQTERDNLLPSGLGAGARVYHKTGDIGTMLADAGLIDTPTGKRYIVAVMVQRPNNDPRAEKFISSVSRAAYQQFTQSTPTPTNTTSSIPQTGYPSPGVTAPVPTTPINPAVVPPVSNNIGNYPSPVFNPQYYPPR